MNASFRFAALGLSVLALGGCATMDDRAAYVPAKSSQMAPIEQDAEYIARVESMARRRGVYLQWVNPPTRRVDTKQ